MIICSLCKREAEHDARGLCHTCYDKARRLGMLGAFEKGRRAPAAAATDRRDYWRARQQADKRYAYWHARYEEKRHDHL